MWSSFGVLLLLCRLNSARPPIVDGAKDPPIIDPADLKKENGSEEWNKAIEYTRYLQEVVQACYVYVISYYNIKNVGRF